jgi:AsmA-like C-terminal region
LRLRADDLEVSVAAAACSAPTSIDGLDATLLANRLSYVTSGERSTLDVTGRLDARRGVVSGMTIGDAGCDLVVARDRVRLDRIGGGLVGGQIDAAVSYLDVTGGEAPAIRGKVVLADGDLTTLFAQLGVPSTETRGRFDLDVDLAGDTLSLASLKGGGNVRIRDGRLADVPWIALIYRRTFGYVLGEWLEPTFSSGEIEFERNGDRIRLPRIRLDSMVSNLPVGLRLTGDGEIGRTGVDLSIVPEILRTDDRLLIAPLLRLLTRPLFSYRVTGPLSNPRVQYRNLAMELLVPLTDDTNRPRIVEPKPPEWSQRF